MILLGLGMFALIAGVCALAWTLAIYALPVVIGIECARLVYATGAGMIGAALVGVLAGAGSYGGLVTLCRTRRTPRQRLAVAMVFAVPAALAGYGVVYGVAREAVSSMIWQQMFSLIGGACIGAAAFIRFAGDTARETAAD